MAQLVGSTCVRCDRRISNELDAGFCATCRYPSHSACRTRPEPPSGCCAACGANVDDLKKREAEVEAARIANTPKPVDVATLARDARSLYRLRWLFLGAVAFPALGIAVLTIPAFRNNPNELSVAEGMGGGAFILAGVASGLVAWWLFMDGKRACRK